MLYSKEEINDTVRELLRQVLRVKPEQILPNTRIFSDLGAESLDVLDLRFRLEKTFAMPITDGEIIDSLGEHLSAEEIDSTFTPDAIATFIKRKLQANTEK